MKKLVTLVRLLSIINQKKNATAKNNIMLCLIKRSVHLKENAKYLWATSNIVGRRGATVQNQLTPLFFIGIIAEESEKHVN